MTDERPQSADDRVVEARLAAIAEQIALQCSNNGRGAET